MTNSPFLAGRPGYLLQSSDCLGFIRPLADAHTLGISSLAQLLDDCGIRSETAGAEICAETEQLGRTGSLVKTSAWIKKFGISALGFSYRLDPQDGLQLFTAWYHALRTKGMLARESGPVKALFFAGLPQACDLVERGFPGLVGLFRGDETPLESLAMLGVDQSRMPAGMVAGTVYDDMRMEFGRKLVARGEYKHVMPVPRDYAEFGTSADTLEARISAGRRCGQPPLMRAHVGPYDADPAEGFKQFRSWTKELARAGLLDVLSIGTSQLTQSRFFEDRTGLVDGGGVSIQSPDEYQTIWQDARPMLVRTYAGTRDIPRLAAMHESSLHISWHALSFWWFCQLDGRGPYGLKQNLDQHFETMRFAASSAKPLEPNVPHHFAFRGADDVTYIVAGYLAAKAAKNAGIRTLILQVMLNTPKYTWGVQDVAKVRVLRDLVRYLEDRHFRVVLQPRGGLDYFSTDLDKAKAQLAAVTALMADLDHIDIYSPEVIHVVSYSEAVRLADPAVINESVQITRQAFREYRNLKARGHVDNINASDDLVKRVAHLAAEARTVITAIEELVPDPYSPAGFEAIFAAGFLPAPYLWECRDQYPKAVAWNTRLVNGGIQVVDARGVAVSAAERMALIRETWKGGKP